MRRFLQLALITVFGMTLLAADPSTTRLDRIGHKLVCQCGCGQILSECNHVGCPVSPVMLGELRTQVDSGATEKATLAVFINKYGPIVLAAPIRGGFDNVAWIVPIAVALICAVGVWWLARRWRTRAATITPPQAAIVHAGVTGSETLHDRIRRETDYASWDTPNDGGPR